MSEVPLYTQVDVDAMGTVVVSRARNLLARNLL